MALPINVSDLTKMLQCGICDKTLSNPKSLRCSHSFCKVCLDGMIEFIDGGSGVLKCPREGCEKCSFISSEQTTNDLHVDYIVKGVVGMVKVDDEETADVAKNFKCNACGDKDIKKYCIHCKVYLCEICVDPHDAIKEAIVPFQYHKQENKLKIYCKEHSTEATYTCSCEKGEFVCVYCVHRAHKNHKFETLINAEKTLKGMLVNKINFSEDLDLQWNETKQDMASARSILHRTLMINKLNCINDYVEFVNKEEEKLKYDFDLLKSYHTKSFSTTVDSVEYFQECMSRENMDILLQRSEIMSKLNSSCKGRKVPEVTVSLGDPCFSEEHPLGLMSIRIYGKRFFIDGNRKTFKSDMPEPSLKDPSLYTLECLLQGVLQLPDVDVNPEEDMKNGKEQSSVDNQSEVLQDKTDIMTDTEAINDEIIGDDTEIENNEEMQVDTNRTTGSDSGQVESIEKSETGELKSDTEADSQLNGAISIEKELEVGDLSSGGQSTDINHTDEEGTSIIDCQVISSAGNVIVEDTKTVEDDAVVVAPAIDGKVDDTDISGDVTEVATGMDGQIDGVNSVDDEAEGSAGNADLVEGTQKVEDEGVGAAAIDGNVDDADSDDDVIEVTAEMNGQVDGVISVDDVAEGSAGNEDLFDGTKKVEDEAVGAAAIDGKVDDADSDDDVIEVIAEVKGQVGVNSVDDETEGSAGNDDLVEGTEKVEHEAIGAEGTDDKVDATDSAADITVRDTRMDGQVDGIDSVQDKTEDIIRIDDQVESTESNEEEVDDLVNNKGEVECMKRKEEEGKAAENNKQIEDVTGEEADSNESILIIEDEEFVVKTEYDAEMISDDSEDAVETKADSTMEPETVKEKDVGIVTFLVENVSKIRDTVISDAVMIQNLPWKIMLVPQYSENDGGKIVRNAGIFVVCDPEKEGSSWLCQAQGKITLKNHKYDDVTKKITDGFFTNEHCSWGHSTFVPWVDLMDLRKGFNRYDVISIEAVIEAEAPLIFKIAQVSSNAPINEPDGVSTTRKRKLSESNGQSKIGLLNFLLYGKKEKLEEEKNYKSAFTTR